MHRPGTAGVQHQGRCLCKPAMRTLFHLAACTHQGANQLLVTSTARNVEVSLQGLGDPEPSYMGTFRATSSDSGQGLTALIDIKASEGVAAGMPSGLSQGPAACAAVLAYLVCLPCSTQHCDAKDFVPSVSRVRSPAWVQLLFGFACCPCSSQARAPSTALASSAPGRAKASTVP